MIFYKVVQKRKDGLVVDRFMSRNRSDVNTVLGDVFIETETEDAWIDTVFVPDEKAFMEAAHGCEDVRMR